MSQSLRGMLALLLFMLSACTSAAPQGGSTVIATDPPLATAVVASSATPTNVPTARATETPLPTETPEVPVLDNGAIKTQVDKLAGWFLGQGKNSALGVAIVRRNPQTGALEAAEWNYGTTEKDGGQQVTSSTIYEIGSITKLFTGILLAQAVDAGEMQLTDPIQKYLPTGIQAPAYENERITLLDLATHRSGLPRDPGTDDIAQLYEWLNNYSLPRAPGAEYSYSNLGYALLGDILARQAGLDFDTLEFQSVSQPLGLMDTRESLNAEQTDRLAQGYTYDGSPAGYFPQSGALSSAGYMHSTLDDMTRFLIANMEPGSTPLAASINLDQALQAGGKDPGTGAALGWDVEQLGTTDERLTKGGATYGFTGYISLQRDGSYGYVLLTNGMYVNGLVPHMLRILSGK
jgi:serine-type D-Ala-D-Ala carboxypeptidase/endopeptidase